MDLPDIKGKYNPWQERHPLRFRDDNQFRRASAYSARKDISYVEQAALYFHELTEVQGFEFVAFSNAEIEETAMLAHDVILVPCFLPNREFKGRKISDELVRLTIKMREKVRYVYDGWIPINSWKIEDVRTSIREIDEALSALALKEVFLNWEPKYIPAKVLASIPLENQHLGEIQSLTSLIDATTLEEKTAIYRSLSWMSQGLGLREVAGRFLFAVFAVESLARFIEEEAKDGTALARLRTSSRLENINDCINSTLFELLPLDPKKAVVSAYFECVTGISRRLRNHMKELLGDESVSLFFDSEKNAESLYDLRHKIAHGSSNVLSEAERDRISARLWDVELIARTYVLEVLKKALGAGGLSKGQKSMFLGPESFVAKGATHYGPTHMAVLYS